MQTGFTAIATAILRQKLDAVARQFGGGYNRLEYIESWAAMAAIYVFISYVFVLVIQSFKMICTSQDVWNMLERGITLCWIWFQFRPFLVLSKMYFHRPVPVQIGGLPLLCHPLATLLVYIDNGKEKWSIPLFNIIGLDSGDIRIIYTLYK